jgi:DNA polymerase III epsilon subunit-like protein
MAVRRTLIFDTETTLLIKNSLMSNANQPHIIEFFGHILDEDDQVIETLEFLCKPPVKISEEVTKITGFVAADVADAKPFKFYAEQVAGIIGRADSVVAHNLSYDWAVINIEMDRIKHPVNWPLIRICTVEETEHLKGYRLGLSALHEHLFGETFTGAHRAKVDTLALTRCFSELRRQGAL